MDSKVERDKLLGLERTEELVDSQEEGRWIKSSLVFKKLLKVGLSLIFCELSPVISQLGLQLTPTPLIYSGRAKTTCIARKG